MRRVIAQIPADYAADAGVRLFGPDADGAIDTAAPVQSGRRLVHGAVDRESWLEGGWLNAPWMEPVRWAGWLETAWLGGEWLQELEPVWLVSEPIEHGVVEVGMQAFDEAGESTLSVNTGNAFVVSAPEQPKDLAVSVAASRVTVAFE